MAEIHKDGSEEIDVVIETGGPAKLCQPNEITLPNADQARVLETISTKKAVKKVEDLQKADGFLSKLLKKDLTTGVARDAFEVALGEKHFNDKVRNDLIELMLRDVNDIADAATSPEWSREAELVARWNDELKVEHGDSFSPGELKLVMQEIYGRAADLVGDMGFKNKSIKESAKCFDGTDSYDKTTGTEGAEREKKFKVFKGGMMKVFTDGLPTNLPETHPRYDPMECYVIVETDDEANVGQQDHQRVYIGVNQGHAELKKMHKQSGGWYDVTRNAVTTSEWKKGIQGDFDKVMKDSKKK
ncbi:MAG: hypothetical protein WCX69_06210 [Candidatus Paceibacterota bacterium]